MNPTPPSISRLMAATKKIDRTNEDVYIRRVLCWQMDGNGGKTFWDAILQHMELQCVMVMQVGLPYIKVMHSAFTYSNPHGDQCLQNKTIGFVGDGSIEGDPVPVILGPIVSWEWKNILAVFSAVPLETHYGEESSWEQL